MILVNLETDAFHFGDLEYAVALGNDKFTEDEIKEKTEKEWNAVMRAWNDCVSEQQGRLGKFWCRTY
jgi:hypothetical protein